jgi:hypothetical protein
MASIIPIIASIIAVGGVLMGTWFGARLMRGKEERQWRRDRCLEIYTDFILACEIVATQADVVVIQRKHETDHDTADIELLHETVKDMSRAADRALLSATSPAGSSCFSSGVSAIRPPPRLRIRT